MIHEEICTYEVCKLAKEKGFNWVCPHYFRLNDKDLFMIFPSEDWSDIGERINAPTQSLLQRWLREERGIHIAVFPNMANSFAFDYIVYNKGDKFWNPVYTAHSDFDTYELALEDAELYVLKNLV